MLIGVTFRPLCTGTLLAASLLLFASACADDPDATLMAPQVDNPTPTTSKVATPTSAITSATEPTNTPSGQAGKEGVDRSDLVWACNYPGPSAGQHSGSGVLEQLVLEKELVVWTELANVEYKAVENEAIKFELKGPTPAYESHMYTLLIEAELRVHEYLRGRGPTSYPPS